MSELFDEAPTVSKKERRTSARSQYLKRKRRRTSIALFFSVLLVAIATVVAFPFVRDAFTGEEIVDYTGSGSGEVVVEIPEGATGSSMGTILHEAGVVASPEAFIEAFNADGRAASIQPGFYTLAHEMSGQNAVTALLDPARKAEITITIPEGFTKTQVAERVATVLEVDAESVTNVMADAAAIGLPAEANGDPEGWFAPLTYAFGPNVTATDVLKTMVEHRVSDMESLGIDRSQWARTLTIASIVEREVNWPDYYGQVARVIENRLIDKEQVNGRLQMDSTVLYGVGKSGGVPTSADLENDNPYNTYLHPGLPKGPISSPSLDVLQASTNPPAGDWLYFVTVNLESGETLFTSSLAEHNENVARLQQWVAVNGNN